MLKLIVGVKGTGKTKTLINLVNEATEKSNGSVVCVEKGDKLIHEISYKARLIDTDEFKINNADELYGFVSGIYASNHDITDIFIDSAVKICNNSIEALSAFIEKTVDFVNKNDVNLVITASMAEENISEDLKKYMIAH